EVKTKPTQHSVMSLKRSGLTPDCLFLRADQEIDAASIEKLSIMCGLKKEFIFHLVTAKPVFQAFINLDKQEVVEKIQAYFGITKILPAQLSEWRTCINQIVSSKQSLRIGLIAKYVGGNDPYISVIEAINAAAYLYQFKIELVIIEAEVLSKDCCDKNNAAWEKLRSVDGIIVPGGFDARGVEGKIAAAQWAREHNIPYLGLCLG